jgi:hypothetical protein
MRLDFIARTVRTSGLLLLIFLPFGIYYMGVYPSLAVFSGGVWSMVNLLFLGMLVRTVIKPGKIDAGKAVGMAVIKFPLLYLAGYALVNIELFGLLELLAGFSVIPVVMLLKSVSRALLGIDNGVESNNNLQGAL